MRPQASKCVGGELNVSTGMGNCRKQVAATTGGEMSRNVSTAERAGKAQVMLNFFVFGAVLSSECLC